MVHRRTRAREATGCTSKSVARLALLTALVTGFFVSTGSRVAAQQRVLGLDVSYWQGHIQQSHWNTVHSTGNRDFVFIRSSRGGTTGVDQPQGTPGGGSLSTLSRRYDDPRFVQNITRATQAGLFAGAYHFSRPDIVTNTGADEANHFLEMAGAWMRPGYLLPVHDLEAGDGIRSDNDMAQFTIDFSDRIYDVMGIRPAIYVNGNYANYVLGGASSSLRAEIYQKHPTLWMARWPNQQDPDSIDVQNGHPSDSISWTYGLWDDYGVTHPWVFWQYASTVSIPGLSDSTVDGDVLQGGIEFLKDHLVPALWMNDSSGNWNTLANWNSGQTPQQPPVASGQATPYATGPLPTPRLPGADDAVNNIDGQNDTVIIDRPSANITVTLDSGVHEIRKLYLREALNLTGGSLTINYVPSADSTPIAAQFSAPVALDGGSLSVHTLQVDATQTFSLSGTIFFDTVQLMPDGSAPATIAMIGDVDFTPLDDAASAIVNGAGAGNSGLIDLGGANRVWQISDGGAVIDLSIDVPLVNGAFSKSGAGALALGGANSYAGDTTVIEGILSLGNSFLDDAADVYLSTGATLDLDFMGSPDVIDSLLIDGVSQSAGVWGAVGSGAQFTSPLITGTGLLEVTTFVAPIPGDFDGNGFVDDADLAQWESDYGMNGDSDADNDGDSDGADFLIWQQNLGEGVPPIAVSQAVPEPSTMVLLAGSAAIGVFYRRGLRDDTHSGRP